ncbi:MAG: biotin/lipoyl-binding protein [Betaproteobacteria bacterium]|nr:MAG: biotin/lipoyl-binding protein [Betaproteobacteria bacterium]
MARETIKAEITGNVWKIVAQVDQDLAEQETILIMESMKMEVPVLAPVKGKLKELLVKEGQDVSEGQDLAILET